MYKTVNVLNKNSRFINKLMTPSSTNMMMSNVIGGSVRNFVVSSSKPQYDRPSEKAQSHIYHRNSTLYSYTPREVLKNIEQSYISPPDFEAITFGDKFAKYSVQFLRKFSNLFFKEKYIHYAVVLETVAACPGLVAGMMLHLKTLRNMESNNWIKILMDEMENERMHLLSFIEITKPTLTERMMVAAAQAIYWNLFLVFYVTSPKTAHRFVGYLEHQACITYTNFLRDIDAGKVENVKAPQLAIDYWGLPADATLRDMILVIRQDESDHRAANHEISNKIKLGSNDPVIIENIFHKPTIVDPIIPSPSTPSTETEVKKHQH